MMRTLFLTFTAGYLALALDWCIAAVALRFTGVPKGFPPFTFLPILSGTVGGAVLASLVYSITKAVARRPDSTFLFIAIVTLVLSFALPLRLSFTHSHRFAGVTPSAQMVLVLMHTVVATISVAVLLARPMR